MNEEERVLSLLDKTYTLHSVDYRSNLDDCASILQKAIQGDISDLDEMVDEWTFNDFYGFDYAVEELVKSITEEFQIDNAEAEKIYDKYRDRIQEEIYERDDSNVLRDLIRNTKEFAIFYDLNVDIAGYPSNLEERLKEVKRALRIKIRDTRYDENLREMVGNASYGGSLVIYFNTPIEDLFNVEAKTISFTDPVIAIIDTMNGSGGDCTIPNVTLSFPFKAKNLYICKSIKYGYTHAVCGMSDSWCKSTIVHFHGKPLKNKSVESETPLQRNIKQEEYYNKIFKQGKCSAGDMDVNRHRQVQYINSIPCGLKCTECGTFWID